MNRLIGRKNNNTIIIEFTPQVSNQPNSSSHDQPPNTEHKFPTPSTYETQINTATIRRESDPESWGT